MPDQLTRSTRDHMTAHALWLPAEAPVCPVCFTCLSEFVLTIFIAFVEVTLKFPSRPLVCMFYLAIISRRQKNDYYISCQTETTEGWLKRDKPWAVNITHGTRLYVIINILVQNDQKHTGPNSNSHMWAARKTLSISFLISWFSVSVVVVVFAKPDFHAD